MHTKEQWKAMEEEMSKRDKIHDLIDWIFDNKGYLITVFIILLTCCGIGSCCHEKNQRDIKEYQALLPAARIHCKAAAATNPDCNEWILHRYVNRASCKCKTVFGETILLAGPRGTPPPAAFPNFKETGKVER
jgi:hypothetical protein